MNKERTNKAMRRVCLLWNSGIRGKILVGCGALLALFLACLIIMIVVPSPASTPQADITSTPVVAKSTSDALRPTPDAATASPPKLSDTSSILIPASTSTSTPPYYHIPSELSGRKFGLYECTYGECDPPGLPDAVQAEVGKPVFTVIGGVQVEITLQNVSYSIENRKWRKFVTVFEFQNPSDETFTIVSEEFFDAWGNCGNWRCAIVVLNTKANFVIRPGATRIDLQWTTNAQDNPTVWITINSKVDRRSIILDEHSAIYRVEFPPVSANTPTPTRTPVN